MAVDPNDPLNQPQQQPQTAQPQAQLAAPKQPKQTQQQRRLSSLYNIANKARPDDTIKQAGQLELSKVKNVADVNKQTAGQLEQKSEGMKDLKFDMSQAWKPPAGQTIIADEKENKSKGFTQQTLDTNIEDEVKSGVDSAQRGTLGSLTFTKDIAPEAIDNIRADIQETRTKSIKDYYGQADTALQQYSEDASRFLDSMNANINTLSDVGQQSTTETDAEMMATGLTSGQLSNAGLANLLSAYGAGMPEIAALNSQIYNADIQNLRNSAGATLADLQGAQSQKASATNALQSATTDARKRLTDWTQSEKDRLTDELNTALQTVNKSGDTAASGAKQAETERKQSIENENKARVERKMSSSGDILAKYQNGDQINRVFGIINDNPNNMSPDKLVNAVYNIGIDIRAIENIMRDPDLTPQRQEELGKLLEKLKARDAWYTKILKQRNINPSDFQPVRI